jgi:hypothetical protein
LHIAKIIAPRENVYIGNMLWERKRCGPGLQRKLKECLLKAESNVDMLIGWH